MLNSVTPRTIRSLCTGALAALTLSVAAESGIAQAAASRPEWRSRWIPWNQEDRPLRPWRKEARLTQFGIRGYPDDFQVEFANPDPAAVGREKFELMWVRLIAYDSSSDQYLGWLLNQPFHIRTVTPGDNVVIQASDTGSMATAQRVTPEFAAVAWPDDAYTPAALTLRAGLGHYRLGNSGHNQVEIAKCIAVLGPVLEGAPPLQWRPTREQSFIAHFVLGRCMAEKYETVRAVRQFRAAIALDSSDLDAQMALLAELSILVHRKPGTFSEAEDARWADEFVAQLAVVRRRFGSHDQVQQITTAIFDPKHEAELDPVWIPHVERLRRVGYATFRWKRR